MAMEKWQKPLWGGEDKCRLGFQRGKDRCRVVIRDGVGDVLALMAYPFTGMMEAAHKELKAIWRGLIRTFHLEFYSGVGLCTYG